MCCLQLIDQLKLCAVVAGFFCAHVEAADYYVDALLGSDDASGMQQQVDAANGPWRTLGRINRTALQPGDRVLLKCGAIWNESVTLSLKGSASLPIVVGAYGDCSGKPPEIRPSSVALRVEDFRQEVTGWSAPLNAIPGMLFSTEGVIAKARFPARGWLNLKLAQGLVRIDPQDIPSDANLPGVDWVVRTNDYTIEVRRLYGVSKQGEAATAKQFSFPPSAGAGYYLEGKPWMLRYGTGWAYDADSRRLYVQNQPTEALAAATAVAVLTLDQPEHVRIQGVSLRFAPLIAIEILGGRDIELSDLDIKDVGQAFVRAKNTDDIRVTRLSARRSQQDGISLHGGSQARVSDSQFLEIGVSANPRKSIAAILVDSSSSAMLTNNRIDHTGYAAVMFGRNAVVERNVITRACAMLTDCGAIYTSGANKQYGYYASRVSGNLISEVLGNIEGAAGKIPLTAGIYLDDESRGIEVSDNFIEGAQRGIFSKAATSVIMRNTLFDNVYGVRLGPTGANSKGADATLVEDNSIISKPEQMPFLVNVPETGETISLISNRIGHFTGALDSQIWRGPVKQARPAIKDSKNIGRAFSLLNTSQDKQSYKCPLSPKECRNLRWIDGTRARWPIELMPGKAAVIIGPLQP